MFQSTLALALISFSVLSRAQFIEPKDICAGLHQAQDKTECQRIVDSTAYFDSQAVAMCYSFTFEVDKVSCLRITADKVYEETALNTCKSQELGSRRLQCLMQYGRRFENELPASRCIKISALQEELKRSIVSLSQGDAEKSYAIQTNLLKRVQTCEATKSAIH